MKLIGVEQPGFQDHFPRLGRGHGSVPRSRVMTQDGENFSVRKRQPLCAQQGCQQGEQHKVGRAKNAAGWMADVAYSGPDCGVIVAAPKKRAEKVHNIWTNCERDCLLRGVHLHSVCVMPASLEGLRYSPMEAMLHRVGQLDQLSTGTQIEHRLKEYAGVELLMREADAATTETV